MTKTNAITCLEELQEIVLEMDNWLISEKQDKEFTEALRVAIDELSTNN